MWYDGGYGKCMQRQVALWEGRAALVSVLLNVCDGQGESTRFDMVGGQPYVGI